MKLNPPASSSDLEAARQIARRLHQHRRREDDPFGSRPLEDALPRPRPTPPPLPGPQAPPEPPPPPMTRPVRESHAPEPPRQPEPEPSFEPEPPEPALDLPEPPPVSRPAWREPEAPAPEPEPLEELAEPAQPPPFDSEEPRLTPETELPDVDVDEPALSPEEMVGAPDSDASPLEDLAPEPSPFGEDLLDEPQVADEPAPPSWDEIVETCRGLAQADAAMLIDPAGQVFSARGDWPPPGPDAIAAKLVAMMAKTLKDAPTRSISAPLMGMHLTAWRVPLSEGLVTAAFIGAAPVRADARPLIDTEVISGVGS